MDTQLAALMKSGEFARIYDKWFVEPIPPRHIPLGLPMSATLKSLVAAPNDKPAESYLPK